LEVRCACYFMSFCVPCYLDYACSLDRNQSLTPSYADSEECRLVREREINDHLLSRLINGRKIYSLHTRSLEKESERTESLA
jgi:hypothetical protein